MPSVIGNAILILITAPPTFLHWSSTFSRTLKQSHPIQIYSEYGPGAREMERIRTENSISCTNVSDFLSNRSETGYYVRHLETLNCFMRSDYCVEKNYNDLK